MTGHEASFGPMFVIVIFLLALFATLFHEKKDQ
jgi:hypothetical protein